jgi:HAD superfamily hydrolase (TIGR01484 family)
VIRAIITDIDGVILGNQNGVNFPSPSIETFKVFTQLQNASVPISLCTAKAFFAIEKNIIQKGKLSNYHITDAGGLLITGSGDFSQATPIDKTAAKELFTILINESIYVELYTPNNYYVSRSITDTSNSNANISAQSIMEGRVNNLGLLPKILESIDDITEPIIKLYTLPESYFQIDLVNELAVRYRESMVLHWGKNPSLNPATAGFFTSPKATKELGIQKISQLQNIPLSETLGIGDSTNDWSFIQHCGYAAAPSNASDELKAHITSLGDKGYVSNRSVDDNAFADIVSHFLCNKL